MVQKRGLNKSSMTLCWQEEEAADEEYYLGLNEKLAREYICSSHYLQSLVSKDQLSCLLYTCIKVI